MKDQYVIGLIQNNPKYKDKFKNNKEFHDAVEKYTRVGSAEMVIKILYDICK